MARFLHLRTLGIVLGALTAAGATFTLGCGDSDGATGPRTDSDSGPQPDLGGAFLDAGMELGGDAGGSPPSPSGYAGIPAAAADSTRSDGEDPSDDDVSSIRSCYDGLDNNADPLIDCEDPACFGVASCCVDSGREDCCTAAEPLTEATFDECGSADGCIAGSLLFGAPAPFLAGGALGLGGDALYDSGVLLADPLDLRGERVSLSATFVDTTSCSGCLDGAAFGVTAQAALDDQAHVMPLVALQRNAGEDARLRTGDRTLLHVPVTEGEPFTLVLRPDGRGEVRHAGVTHPFEHRIGRIVHGVAWGYSSNPSASAPEGVFLDDLSVERARCSVATGWRARGATAGAPTGALLRVSTALDAEGTRWIALDDRDGLLVGVRTEAGAFEARALELGTIEWGTAHRDWSLTFDGTDLWLTFLADDGALPAMGRARLVGSIFEAETGPFFRPTEPIGSPRWVVALEHQLIVAETGSGIGLWGQGPLVPGSDGTWLWLDSDLAALTADARQPDLVRTREGVWLLHYARPAGTRWVVGLAASDELVAWRPMDAVLQGSGDLDDFDGLGASGPAVALDGDELTLHYVGHGSAARTLGEARRWLGAAR